MTPTVIDHALARHKLSTLRDKECRFSDFRRVARELAEIIAVYSTSDLPLREGNINAASGHEANAPFFDHSKVVLLPILRTGLILSEAFIDLMPGAKTGHIGLYHDYRSGKLIQYMTSLPSIEEGDIVFVLDGVIGTAESLVSVMSLLSSYKVPPSRVRVAALVGHRVGLERFYSSPQNQAVRVFCAGLEQGLDTNGYPSFLFGNAADRLFGTEEI